MGRTKAVPVQRVPSNEAHTTDAPSNTAVTSLGRRRLLDLEASGVRAARTEETVPHVQGRTVRDEANAESDTEASDDDVPQQPSESSSGSTTASDDRPVSRLASIVERIERNEAAKRARRGNRRTSAPGTSTWRGKVRKQVSFDQGITMILPPEVLVESREMESNESDSIPLEADSSQRGRTLVIHSRQKLLSETEANEAVQTDSDERVWWIHHVVLSSVADVRVESDGLTMLNDVDVVSIVTKQGAVDLWTLAMNQESTPERPCLVALGRCVEAGLLQMRLKRRVETSSDCAVLQLDVGLSRRALNVCHPDALPFRSRSWNSNGTLARTSTAQQMARDVYGALAMVFPRSILYDTLNLRDVPPVTASRVYALIDNVSLQAAWERQGAHGMVVPPLRQIPGLQPTLRPYQAEAVEWMIQRETQTSPTNEWELAWVVLPKCDNSSSPNVVPLSNVAHRNDLQDCILCCPFTGWLASSVDEARTMTLGSSSDDVYQADVKGGILAESMGLGKSVEVLACILANPYVPTSLESATPCSENPVQRTLAFESTEENRAPSQERAVHYVEDVSMFGDADDSDNESMIGAQPSDGATPAVCTTVSEQHLVTPPKDVFEAIQERWTDDDVLGSCICGDLIGFSKRSKPDSVVLCESCNEPMHTECAAFSSIDDMKRETKAVRFRQRFTNFTLDCRECRIDRCPCCAESLKSGATLIVTPPAILNQWEREIYRHTRRDDGQPLRVAVYDGVKQLTQVKSAEKRRLGMRLMHPTVLADYDVVLMTFDALMSDLGHADDNQYVARPMDSESGGNLRKRKRYRVVPSPLLAINWWRVCLDEAQRVETPTAGSARMALKLEANHRWCISGTPIGRGKLDDLYGLLLFLRMNPFSNQLWFRKCFNPAYRDIDDRIKCLLGNISWRSTKKLDLVREQMGLKKQTEKKIMLQFSSIEKHFYNRQLEQTLSAAGEVVSSKRGGKKKAILLTDHLHKLRAACCHPQVGSSGLGALKRSRGIQKDGDASVSSRVMTMSQILDKLIDDAKLQCEESLRLAVLHTNGMAATSKLKVEAKLRDATIPESDVSLLNQSCNLYLQSIQLADENAEPTLILGESSLSGSTGFRTPRKTVHRCSITMEWNRSDTVVAQEAWSKFDFTCGPARKITQLRIKAKTGLPSDLTQGDADNSGWDISYPKDCLFQCSTSSGEFMDVHAFFMPFPSTESMENDGWILESGFRTNKSKSWRLVVQTFHGAKTQVRKPRPTGMSSGAYTGIDVEFFEAAVANDPLQRLHCLHNATLSFSSLLQANEAAPSTESDVLTSTDEVRQNMEEKAVEARKIERLYLDSARAVHAKCRHGLEETSTFRNRLERELLDLSHKSEQPGRLDDCWDDLWWNDFLIMCHMYGNETQQRAVRDKLVQDLDDALGGGLDTGERVGHVPFPMFQDITGLRTALQMRVSNIRTGLGTKTTRRSEANVGNVQPSGIPNPREGRFKCAAGKHAKCIQTILDLSPHPTEQEIFENSHCKVCKADWFQTGPMCRFCNVGEELEDLAPDKVTMIVLGSLFALLKGTLGTSLIKASHATGLVLERAKKFFDLFEASKKERTAAWRHWRTHLNLLNDIDELNQCKSAMRLTYEGEDVTALSAEQLLAVVVPVDVNVRYHDHAAKQAMALGALKRAKGTLNYLKNLNAHEHEATDGTTTNDTTEDTCILCLGPFDSDRAVLQCGHSFHFTPCLEKLRSRSGNAMLFCPLRCRVQTDPKSVMIASGGKSNNDGSHTKRQVKGSYGTKVTRLVSDILDVCDRHEKSLVFSQWDDMLAICEQALSENDISFVRVASHKSVGGCTARFRHPDCSVMLLNVKNGAEGLTLVEATHVFMVEPLLNCGLDNQAINRIHRIGQTRATYVWRYIVEDTVEVKIDKLRIEHQEDQLEESMSEGKKSLYQAGGIDGGFQSQEELFSILQP